jgi:hypothetical protein
MRPIRLLMAMAWVLFGFYLLLGRADTQWFSTIAFLFGAYNLVRWYADRHPTLPSPPPHRRRRPHDPPPQREYNPEFDFNLKKDFP